jgi:hypothetical protein
MSRSNTKSAAPLDEVMLAMDVVDTLRHSENLVARELGEEDRANALMERLREVYNQQGIDVPDRILREGVAALNEARFTYQPPTGGLGYMLARAYVGRKKWGKPFVTFALVFIIAAVGYKFIYQPFVAGQEQAAVERVEVQLPAEMDKLLATIEATAKETVALSKAQAIAERGKTFASAGDAAQAETAVAQLQTLLSTLQDEYRLQIVNEEGKDTGVWTFPEVNQDARNYYIIVEAIGTDGAVRNMTITNEENGETDTVDHWGVRVSEDVFNTIRDDKLDDGIIQDNILGLKNYGFENVDYIYPVLGGEITQW